MLGLYYKIWVDCIVRAKQQPSNKNSWAAGSMIFISLSMVFNLLLLMAVLERHILKYSFYRFNIPGLPLYANNVAIYLCLYILPCVVLNYVLIFRKDKYKELIKRYPYYNGKLFVAYFLTSMLLPIGLMWAGIIYTSVTG